MMSFDYDLFIIGAGSGGLAAAKRAASYGARVGIAEAVAVGGACINYGCIPEKLMAYAANFSSLFPVAVSYGWSECNSSFDWSRFKVAKDQKVEQLHEVHTKYLTELGIEIIWGHGTFRDAHTLDIDGQKITADKILIAVGAKPVKPDIPGVEYAISIKELLSFKKLPRQIGIIGGDYVAIKTAGSLSGLGVKVTVITESDMILANCDEDIALSVQGSMTKHGVKIFTNTKVEKFEQLADGLNLTLMADHNVNLTVDTGLCLKYMAPNLSNLTLENAGVEVTQNGAILVDKYSSTTQPNIFAIGDCTNRMKLTPVAIAEARAFVDTEFGKNPQTLNYELIPISVSSIPEAATVGLTEAQAREKFGESVRCYRQEFKPLFYGLTNKDEKTLLKLVVDGKSERVIGAHMVGQYASEIIQSIALAMKLGATKKDLDTSIGIHPSIAEEIFSL